MLHLHGLGHFHPPTVIDNHFLESLEIGTTADWILENVGIVSRRTVLPLDYLRETRNADPRVGRSIVTHTHAQMAAEASKMALARAGLQPTDIGLVISGCSSVEIGTPSEACLVAAELDIDVPTFDINSACTTFAAQLHYVSQLDPDQTPDYILLTVPETTTPCLDYNVREVVVLFGDAVGAAVVSKRHPGRVRIPATNFGSRPRDWQRVVMPTGGHFTQDGRVVQKFAIKQSAKVYAELAKQLPEGANPFFVAQQASLSLLRSTCMVAGVPDDRHLTNAEEYGNTAAGGAPSVLSQHWESWQPGDSVIMALAGAGLCWGGAWFEVGEERSA